MPETIDTAAEIKNIGYKLASIEGTQELLLREKKQILLDALLATFRRTPQLGEVYLAIDGKRTQAQIVGFLTSKGVQISEPTVSRRMQLLDDEGLIEQVDGTAWQKKTVIERVLGLTKALKKG